MTAVGGRDTAGPAPPLSPPSVASEGAGSSHASEDWVPLPPLDLVTRSSPERTAPSSEGRVLRSSERGPVPQSPREAEAALARGQGRALQAAWRSLASRWPFETALLRARWAFRLAHYEDAARWARQALRRAPGVVAHQAEALRWLGEAEAARGRLQEAADAFDEAVRRHDGAWLARARLGEVLDALGRRAEAEALWNELIDAYNAERIALDDPEGLHATARAAAALGAYRDANETFGRAARLAPEDHALRLAWADLLASKHALGEAAAVIDEVLRMDPRHPRAWLRRARIAVEELRLEDAERALARVLSEAPDLPGAYVVRAGILLRGHDFEGVEGALETASTLRPGDLEALSVRGALAFVRDDRSGFEAAFRAVPERGRSRGRFFVVVGDYADWEHRYEDLVELARKAVRFDPELAAGHAMLGFNLLRLGRDGEGLAALRAAWDRDPYDVRVYNTLEFYEHVVPRRYEDVSIEPPFVLRLPREQREPLLRLVPPLIERAWRTMAGHYPRRPDGRVRIELYPDPEHFAVRTAGVPRIAVQGVCFGPVVTALAPGAGAFDWGQVLWHELAHVFHLAASRGRVPRWFTEGLAEWEAAQANPRWRRHDDALVLRALRRGELPSLARLDRLFTRASSVQEALLAYTLAYRAVSFLVERFGFERVAGLLTRFGGGRPVEVVLREQLGESLDALDAAFAMWEEARLGRRWQGWTPRWHELARRFPPLRTALASLSAGDASGALASLRSALDSVDGDATLHAAVLLGYLTSRPGVRPSNELRGRVLERLRRAVEGSEDGWIPRLLLAREALRRGRIEAAIEQLRAARRLAPDADEPLRALLRIARSTKRPALELESLEALWRLQPAAPEPWRRLIERASALRRWDMVCRLSAHTEMLAPLSFDAWLASAEACARSGQERQARRALRLGALLVGDSASRRARLDAARRLLSGDPDGGGS